MVPLCLFLGIHVDGWFWVWPIGWLIACVTVWLFLLAGFRFSVVVTSGGCGNGWFVGLGCCLWGFRVWVVFAVVFFLVWVGII